MKQHITKKQWDELSEKEQWLLLSEMGFLKKEDKYPKDIYIFIGQMIEFLGDDYSFAIYNPKTDRHYKPDELCDALWEAVKYKLKQ